LPRVFQRGDARGAAAKQKNRTAADSAAVAPRTTRVRRSKASSKGYTGSSDDNG
jgi:hypothetical protein